MRKFFYPLNFFSTMREILAGLFASGATVGSIIFHLGRESNRMDELFSKAYTAEAERKDIHDVIFDIHSKVICIEKDIQTIKSTLD
jgi:hypothetical protein